DRRAFEAHAADKANRLHGCFPVDCFDGNQNAARTTVIVRKVSSIFPMLRGLLLPIDECARFSCVYTRMEGESRRAG
ncbi:MAG: hypothetical protein ACT6U0_23620, partial [Shinella sp.]